MLSDIEIAHSVTPLPILDIAREAGVDEKYLVPYGFDKAKVDYSADDVYKEEAYQAYLGLTHCF